MKPALITKWCAPISTDTNVTRRSPVSTNSNAAGADPIVWFMNGSALNAFNCDTGAVVYPPQGGTAATCDGVQKFTAPHRRGRSRGRRWQRPPVLVLRALRAG